MSSATETENKILKWLPLIVVIGGAAIGYLHNNWTTSDLSGDFVQYKTMMSSRLKEQNAEINSLKNRVVALETNVEWLKKGK